MLKIGIVGLGKMGLLHSSILNATPGVQVVALCEKSRLIRRFASHAFRHIEVVGQVSQLAPFSLDGVFVTTPPSSHLPVVREICAKNLAPAIFVEKPLASSFEEALELCDLATKHGGANVVGYHKRFSLVFQHAAKIIQDGILGEIKNFGGHAYSSDFVGAENSPDRSWSRGGVLRDLGCHIIDTALWVIGGLKTMSESPGLSDPDFLQTSKSFTTVKPSALEVGFSLATPRGVVGHFEVSSIKEEYRLPQIKLFVEGTKGAMSVDDDRLQLYGNLKGSWYRHDFHDQAHFLLGDPEYSREDKSFIDSMVSGSSGVPDFRSGARIEEIIDQIQGKA